MGMAEDIADKVKSKGDTEDDTEVEAVKPGDHGKRILAAIASKDAEALEEAIRDCAESDY